MKKYLMIVALGVIPLSSCKEEKVNWVCICETIDGTSSEVLSVSSYEIPAVESKDAKEKCEASNNPWGLQIGTYTVCGLK